MNTPNRLLAGVLLAASLAARAEPPAVETIPADRIVALAASEPGRLVVSLSSTDARCRPCVGQNARFAVAAQGKRDFARFVQVLWQPWFTIPDPIQSLLRQYNATGVPVTLVFEDGKMVHKTVGELPAPDPVPPAPETGHVPQILPRDAAGTLAASTGTVVVMLSSFETNCPFCLRANPLFEDLARTTPGVRFVRVMYRPWTWSMSESFGKSLDVKGLPVYLTYRDGKPVRRRDGIASVDELRKMLVDGLD